MPERTRNHGEHRERQEKRDQLGEQRRFSAASRRNAILSSILRPEAVHEQSHAAAQDQSQQADEEIAEERLRPKNRRRSTHVRQRSCAPERDREEQRQRRDCEHRCADDGQLRSSLRLENRLFASIGR